MCNACFLRTRWYTIFARIKFIDYKWRSGLLAWDIFANLFLNTLTHFFAPESYLVKLLIGPMNQSLLIWVWAESDAFPYFRQLSLIKSFFALQPLWVESSVVRDKLVCPPRPNGHSVTRENKVCHWLDPSWHFHYAIA